MHGLIYLVLLKEGLAGQPQDPMGVERTDLMMMMMIGKGHG